MSPVFMFPERNCMKRIKYDTYGKTGCDRLRGCKIKCVS